MWNGFWRYRYLLWNLVSRDFKLKYRRSVLGVVWSVLNPLLMCLVYWAVFSSLMDMRGSGIDNFAVFLMCGQLLFNFFNEATSTSMSSVLSAAPLLKKVYIPKYIFPLEKCCFALVNFFFSLVALFFVALVTWSHISLRTVLLAVYPIVMLFVFSLGVGLILSAVYVFFRDIQYLYGIFTMLLMYMSAIFYSIETFPQIGRNLFLLNPVYVYIRYFRKIVIEGTVPSLWFHLIAAGYALIAFAVGFFIYKRKNHSFLYYV